MRTITVKGVGNVTQKPDTIEINLTLINESLNYEEMMTSANTDLEQLRDELYRINFPKDSLKTTNFNVENSYENEKNSDGEYVRVFKGFKSTHNLLLSFPNDTDKLSQTLFVISNSKTHPAFDIAFTVKDTNAITEKLLASAVADATNKAKILSLSSGVSLLDIQTIVYDWANAKPYSNTHYQPRMRAAVAFDASPLNINPEDIKMNDNIMVTWEIK